MVISKSDFALSAQTRETLVPIVGAALSATLAVAMHDTFPVMAGIAGTLAGAAASTLLLHRNSSTPVAPATTDPREARIDALETELASERTMHEAYRQQAEAREEELKRFLADLEMTRSVLESQAAQSVELAEELAEQKQRSDYLATHDVLTGLPNRLAFEAELIRRVELATGAGSTIALLFAGLDRFKDVNDTLGHEAGDELLRQVAGTFGGTLRQEDFVARLGGVEFAAIVEVQPEEARDAAVTIAEHVRRQLRFTVPAPSGDLAVGATLSVALYPQDASNAEGLLRAADQAMYAGKRHGLDRVITTEELKLAS